MLLLQGGMGYWTGGSQTASTFDTIEIVEHEFPASTPCVADDTSRIPPAEEQSQTQLRVITVSSDQFPSDMDISIQSPSRAADDIFIPSLSTKVTVPPPEA